MGMIICETRIYPLSLEIDFLVTAEFCSIIPYVNNLSIFHGNDGCHRIAYITRPYLSVYIHTVCLIT